MLNEITKKINCNEYLNSLDCWYGIRPNGEGYYTAYWFMKDSDGISSVPYNEGHPLVFSCLKITPARSAYLYSYLGIKHYKYNTVH